MASSHELIDLLGKLNFNLTVPHSQPPSGRQSCDSQQTAQELLAKCMSLLQQAQNLKRRGHEASTKSEVTMAQDDISTLPPKYAKMVKMGVPVAAVKLKMMAEGVTSGEIPQEKNKKPKKRIRLHWQTLENVDEARRRNSIWEISSPSPRSGHTAHSLQDKSSSPQALGSPVMDLRDFRAHWASPKSPSQPSQCGKENKRNLNHKLNQKCKNRKQSNPIIDAKRAMTASIALSRLHRAPGGLKTMRNAISNLDDEAFTSEQLIALLKFAPTKAEKKLLRDYIQEKSNLTEHHLMQCNRDNSDENRYADMLAACINLSEGEQCMVSLAFMTPWLSSSSFEEDGLRTRLRCLIYKRGFQERITSIRRDLESLMNACRRVRNSRRLRILLKAALKLGNEMNGNRSSGATAVTLESLTKLSHIKSSQGINGMEYLCMTLSRAANDSELSKNIHNSVLDFADDFHEAAEIALRVDLKVLYQEIEALENECDRCNHILDIDAIEQITPAYSRFQAFTTEARENVMKLHSIKAEATSTFSSILEYFLSDPSLTPAQFFGDCLLHFVKTFCTARRTVENRQQKARRDKKIANCFKLTKGKQKSFRQDKHQASIPPRQHAAGIEDMSKLNCRQAKRGGSSLVVPENIRSLVAAQAQHRARLLSRF